MMVFNSPVRSDDEISYEFNGTNVTCIINDEMYNTYDVSQMIDIDPNSFEKFMPIRSVLVDEQGVYWVRLLKYHGFDAPEEVRFPDWVEV